MEFQFKEYAMKIMPTTFLLIAILLCVALGFLVPVSTVFHSPWNLLGLIPIIFGIWTNLAADRAFKQANTTVKPFEESQALILEGVFRLSRNPMYLGFVGILLGVCILLGSISPHLVWIVFIIWIDRIYIRIEEQMLQAKFGEAWRQYRSKVRKWL